MLLATVTIIPFAAFTWLGIRVLQQDRRVERQQQRELQQLEAERFALELEREFQDHEEHLTPLEKLSLLYESDTTQQQEGAASAFATPELEEFQHQDLAKAATEYGAIAKSAQGSIRGAALVRLGRVLRKQGDQAGALQAYSDLAPLGGLLIEGQPAALLSLQARCRLFEEFGNREELHREAAELSRALSAGGRRIDRETFGLYRDMVQGWGADPPRAAAIARTDAALHLWKDVQTGELPNRGRRIFREGGLPVLALWSGGPDRPAVWIPEPGEWESMLSNLSASHHLAVSLYDPDGQPLWGDTRPGEVSLTPAETHLPFVLNVAEASGGTSIAAGRTALIGGLAGALLLMLAAGYALYHATTREVNLARQQSDFVSAVSHEFRTPLTSLRHLTELLAAHSVTSEERRTKYYALLAQETERLHRLVEGLLSFGRIEEGAYAWSREPADPGELVRGVVEEFRQEHYSQGHNVIVETESGLPPIRADREALGRAVWNLLDNAGKYSPEGSPIRVSVHRQAGSVLLDVEDQGSGIVPEERQRIFQKFVRGADAKRAGIRGVGIGLALVQRIVEAHGGSIQLESELGRGSKFTLVLPCDEF